MVDPLTAAAAASAAFSTVKKAVEMGRSVEDTMGQIAQWYSHAADFSAAEARSQKMAPFKRVVSGKSVQAESLEILAARKQIQFQNAEVIKLIRYTWGNEGLAEFREIREQIKKQRKAEVYRRQKIKDQFMIGALVLTGMVPIVGLTIAVASTFKGG